MTTGVKTMQNDPMAAARAAKGKRIRAKDSDFAYAFTPKQEQMIKAVSEDAPSKLGLFRSVYSGKSTPRQSIKAHCLECMGFEVRAIRECTSSQCGLWGKRPYQTKQVQRGKNDTGDNQLD